MQREAEDGQDLAAILGEGLDQRRLGDFPELLDFGEFGRVVEPPAEIGPENADQNAEQKRDPPPPRNDGFRRKGRAEETTRCAA